MLITFSTKIHNDREELLHVATLSGVGAVVPGNTERYNPDLAELSWQTTMSSAAHEISRWIAIVEKSICSAEPEPFANQ
jgi:hypothetical protein